MRLERRSMHRTRLPFFVFFLPHNNNTNNNSKYGKFASSTFTHMIKLLLHLRYVQQC